MILLLINVMLLVLGCLVDMAPSILITTPILLPVVMKFGVDPVHFGMIMLMNLGIGLCHPPVGATLFVGCAVGRVRMEDVMQRDLAVLRRHVPGADARSPTSRRFRSGCRAPSPCDFALSVAVEIGGAFDGTSEAGEEQRAGACR